MTIGQRIEKIRKDNNLSQAEFGEKLGVSRQSVSRWESDASIPDIEKLVKISKLYNVSIDYLMGNETPVMQTPKKAFKWFNLLMIVGLLASFFLIYNMTMQIKEISYAIYSMPQRPYIDLSFMDDFKNELIETIVNVNSMALKKDVSYQGDLLNKATIEFNVSITPKNNDIPDRVLLQVESGDDILEVLMEKVDDSYIANIDVPLTNYMVFIAKFTYDENVISEIIDIKLGLLDQSFADIALQGYTSAVNFEDKGRHLLGASFESDAELTNEILAKVFVNNEIFEYRLPINKLDECYGYKFCYEVVFSDNEFSNLINFKDYITVEYYYVDDLNRISPIIGSNDIGYIFP